MENHALHIFAPKNIKVAEEISKTIGTQTIKNKSRTKQILGKSSISESVSDYGRSLLLPQEVKDIGQDKELLILENCLPILCNKIKWYEDALFAERGNNGNIVKWKLPKILKIDPNDRVIGKIHRFDDVNVQGNNEQVDEREEKQEKPVKLDDFNKKVSLDKTKYDFESYVGEELEKKEQEKEYESSYSLFGYSLFRKG